MTTPQIGCTKDELDTPALCIDLDVLDANIEAVAGACRRNNVAWRPHQKCHKSPAIARMELAAGALGVTCAKVGEAEVMAARGVTDILIANMIVGPAKMRRLAALRRVADPIVCVDHEEQVRLLSDAMSAENVQLRVLIETDIGMARCGVELGRPTVELARKIVEAPRLELAGIMGYEGHLLQIQDLAEKEQRIHGALACLVDTAQQIRDAGLPCPIVSCGGTGSYIYSITHPGITEVQAGGAIFMDLFYRNRCQVPDLQYAVTVLTTVVSRPAADRAIIDSGRKTLNQELYMPAVAGHPDITVKGLSAEHGALTLGPGAADLRIGQRLELIPGYVDFTTVLHDQFYGFRNGRLEVIWPIEGRGKIR